MKSPYVLFFFNHSPLIVQSSLSFGPFGSIILTPFRWILRAFSVYIYTMYVYMYAHIYICVYIYIYIYKVPSKSFLHTKYGQRTASTWTLTWLIESEALPSPYHPAMMEWLGEKDSLICQYSAFYYLSLILACYHSLFKAKCSRVSYFLVTVYIYIL